MFDHNRTVIDCPKCNRHDFVEEENNHWVYLNCGYSRDAQTHRSVADCPKCGKRDFVEEENNRWYCMKCGYSRDLFKSEPSPDAGMTALAVILGILVALALFSI